MYITIAKIFPGGAFQTYQIQENRACLPKAAGAKYFGGRGGKLTPCKPPHGETDYKVVIGASNPPLEKNSVREGGDCRKHPPGGRCTRTRQRTPKTKS